MDGKNSGAGKNEKEENKDQNSGGQCTFTKEPGKGDDVKNLSDELDHTEELTSRMESSHVDECMATDVDGRMFGKAKETSKTTPPPQITIVKGSPSDFDAEAYNMDHKRRGVAVIFNNVHFGNMETRKGSEKDCDDLAKSLMKLDFEIRICKNPTSADIAQTLRNTAAEDHSDADCLIVTVMSHGDSSLLHSADSLYPAEMLWTPFTADRCPTLAGKPKLFFIQACRGDKLDQGVRIMHDRDETDSGPTSYCIPVFADIMVASSSVAGFYSWRNPDDGSWFIQAICKEFDINGHTRDLLTMMTFVNRRVAIHYKSYVPHHTKFHGKKQVPSFTSMLTRLVYFPKKSKPQ